MLVSIPPKFEVAQALEYLKGKRAINIVQPTSVSGRTMTVRAFGHGAIPFQLWTDDSVVRVYIRDPEVAVAVAAGADQGQTEVAGVEFVIAMLKNQSLHVCTC